MASTSTGATSSPIKPRPVPDNFVLTDAAQRRLLEAFTILSDEVRTCDKDGKQIVLWQTADFVLKVAHANGLPFPVNELAPAQSTAAPQNLLSKLKAARAARPRNKDSSAQVDASKAPDNQPRQQSTALKILRFDPLVGVTLEELRAQRDAFVNDLATAQISIMVDLATRTDSFTRDEAHRMANQLFSELLGSPAVTHVKALIEEYKAIGEGGLHTGAAWKAARFSRDQSIPTRLRRFCRTFAEKQAAQEIKSKPKLTFLREILCDVLLARQILILQNPATQAERRELLTYLQEHDYLEKGPDKSLKTGIKNFFSQALALDDKAFEYLFQRIMPVQKLVSVFGRGILVFLQREHVNVLRGFGYQKMNYAIDRLDFNCAWVEDLAMLADNSLLEPIVEGRSLVHWNFDTTPGISWTSRFLGEDEDTPMSG